MLSGRGLGQITTGPTPRVIGQNAAEGFSDALGAMFGVALLIGVGIPFIVGGVVGYGVDGGRGAAIGAIGLPVAAAGLFGLYVASRSPTPAELALQQQQPAWATPPPM